ncbi:ABC transporter ATP-binding protein [[Mycoplasma] collis]|uniref:ABC transporter ATP-binding protein n=1 Tax=[Mycoplasma] collis TaxID=2127 RepID=UPI0006911E83|nr:ABC transporter ATP-binding protein [[Mycoplasma] collis]
MNKFRTKNFNNINKLSFKESKTILKKTFKLIWNYNKLGFWLVIFFIFISSLGNIFNQLFIGKFLIDGVLINPQTNNLVSIDNFDYTKFYLTISLGILIFSLNILSVWLYQWIIIKIAFNVIKRIRIKLYEHGQKLSISFYDTNKTGDLLTRYTSDIDVLRQFILSSIPQFVNTILSIITLFVLMIWLNWFLTIINVVLLAGLIHIAKAFSKKTTKNFIARQKLNGKINGFSEEIFNGLSVVKVFNYEDKAFEKFNSINEEFYQSEKKANQGTNILFPLIWNVGIVIFSVITIIGAIILTNSKLQKFFGLSIGSFVSFVQISRTFSFPIVQLSQQANTIIMSIAGSKRVYEILETNPEEYEGKISLAKVIIKNNKIYELEDFATLNDNAILAWKIPTKNNEFCFKPVKGEIIFNNVWFGYSPDNMILKNINIHILPGQKIALVGPTGAGKTTFTNLINRFYDIQKGEILYDGINIKLIDKKSLRRSLTIVLQESNLFSDTIKNNISYGSKVVDEDKLIESAKIANLNYFIESQSEKYETFLENSANDLSQGQKQLFSIARASYKDSSVVILDEATSSIDTKTEALVQQAMDNLMTNRTSFVIAHRLSTIKNADLILVLNNGTIIEHGNHDELLKLKKYYYNLWKSSTSNLK